MKSDNMIASWHAVQFDETDDFNIAPEDRKFIDKIFATYFFNSNEHHFLCEATPSYWMLGLHHDICFTDCADDVKRNELFETYGMEPCEDHYRHVSTVKNLPKKDFNADDGEDVSKDDVRDYWQGNWPF